MANFWLVLVVLQSSTSIAVPAAALPPRTLMQRLVLATLMKKLPVETSGVMAKACCALPLQVFSTRPVPLVPAPASRHLVGALRGERVQLLPLGAMLKIDVTRPAEAFHCWMGELLLSSTMLPPVRLADSVYW